MWTDYFKLIKLRRGRVITPSHGEIDFSRDDIPVEVCKELFERRFPYLELTELGTKEYDSDKIKTGKLTDPKLVKNQVNKAHRKIAQKKYDKN